MSEVIRPDTVGQRLTAERERAGLNQSELARLTGIDRDKLNKIEHGHRDLSHEEALTIAATLGVVADDLVPRAQRIQYRGFPAQGGEARRVLEAFISDWQMLDGLGSLDED
jgi:transcriptional regulator with XRE-family HTH domain